MPDASSTNDVTPALVISAPSRDLGGFRVRRALPSARRRMVGPFVFLDQMGPAVFRSGEGLDVRPHPHIGLATVTYLFEGEILHRDSLGTVQRIQPGAVNWMTAGRGIAHSERTAPEARQRGGALFGIQLWVALPKAQEELPPSFTHMPASALPTLDDRGVHLRLILGELYGERSPVRVHSELFYAAATLDAGARLPVAASHEERAAYVASGAVECAGEPFAEGSLLLFGAGHEAILRAATGARVVLLGGARLDGPRHLWWNFVSSSADRIRQAAGEWRDGRFAPVPEEHERIPLPDGPPFPVDYP